MVQVEIWEINWVHYGGKAKVYLWKMMPREVTNGEEIWALRERHGDPWNVDDAISVFM